MTEVLVGIIMACIVAWLVGLAAIGYFGVTPQIIVIGLIVLGLMSTGIN